MEVRSCPELFVNQLSTYFLGRESDKLKNGNRRLEPQNDFDEKLFVVTEGITGLTP